MARILIADDEAPMRDMISMACKLDGHQVTQAFDTGSAIAEYTKAPPDLLILDLAMPGGGGVEVLRHLAGQVSMCPVIIVSGYVADLAGERQALLQRHRVIEKPFALETLRNAIREALHGDTRY